MSDFETRVAEALTDGAESAPGATGLADGARRRAGVRRRRRVSVAAAVAVALVAVPVGVVAGRSVPDERTPAAPAEQWRTVSALGVDLEVPADWVAVDDPSCVDPGWAPPPARGCEQQIGLFPLGRMVGGGFAPPRTSPALPRLGEDFVDVADARLLVDSDSGLDREDIRRVLASARPTGAPVPDLAQWRTVDLGGLVADVPSEAIDLDLVVDDGYFVCTSRISKAMWDGGRWTGTYCGFHFVRVSGPTQALVDVVTRSVREDERGESTTAAWQTVSLQGVSLDVPPGWRRVDCERGEDVLLPPNMASCEPGRASPSRQSLP